MPVILSGMLRRRRAARATTATFGVLRQTQIGEKLADTELGSYYSLVRMDWGQCHRRRQAHTHGSERAVTGDNRQERGTLLSHTHATPCGRGKESTLQSTPHMVREWS